MCMSHEVETCSWAQKRQRKGPADLVCESFGPIQLHVTNAAASELKAWLLLRINIMINDQTHLWIWGRTDLAMTWTNSSHYRTVISWINHFYESTPPSFTPPLTANHFQGWKISVFCHLCIFRCPTSSSSLLRFIRLLLRQAPCQRCHSNKQCWHCSLMQMVHGRHRSLSSYRFVPLLLSLHAHLFIEAIEAATETRMIHSLLSR